MLRGGIVEPFFKLNNIAGYQQEVGPQGNKLVLPFIFLFAYWCK